MSYFDDLDDSVFLAALEQVEANLPSARPPPVQPAVTTTTTTTNTTINNTSSLPVLPMNNAVLPVPPPSTAVAVPAAVPAMRWDALTSQHVPRQCKCNKPAAVKVVAKQGARFSKIAFFFLFQTSSTRRGRRAQHGQAILLVCHPNLRLLRLGHAGSPAARRTHDQRCGVDIVDGRDDDDNGDGCVDVIDSAACAADELVVGVPAL